MRYLKTKTLSKYSVADNTLKANQYGRYVMDGVGGLRLPKGTTSERPAEGSVDTPGGMNGLIRYNTTTHELECFIMGVWETVKAPGALAIKKQTLGPGNFIDTVFGPLIQDPPNPNNILVFVENVFQISETNYELLYNYQGSGFTYIQFEEPIPIGKYITILFGFAN